MRSPVPRRTTIKTSPLIRLTFLWPLLAACGSSASPELGKVDSRDGVESTETPTESAPPDPGSDASASHSSLDDQNQPTGNEDAGPLTPSDEPGATLAQDASSPVLTTPNDEPLTAEGIWWLVGFEDPIGITLMSGGSPGSLSGQACLSGNFGSAPTPTQCGDIAGAIAERELEFTMPVFEPTPYEAKVRISRDGQRMAGTFKGAGGWLPWPTAWVRLDGGRENLEPAPVLFQELPAKTTFRLVSAPPGATEYVPDTDYILAVDPRGELRGDFGAFWHEEATLPSDTDGVLHVGPVPTTQEELPIELELALNGATPTGLVATTTSGNTYMFEPVAKQ